MRVSKCNGCGGYSDQIPGTWVHVDSSLEASADYCPACATEKLPTELISSTSLVPPATSTT
jgi:hypothetical protein